MANRNFDSRVIIQRLQNKNYARNLYQQNVDGQRLINNPQNSDGNSSRYVTFVPGAQTDYYRTLAGTTTINQGGIFGIASIPPSTAPPPPSIPGSMYFDSAIVPNGAHVSYPNDNALAIGTRSFTIEWYQYFIREEPFPRVFSIGSEESISIAVSYEQGEGENLFYFWKNSSANFIGITPPYDTWTHIAIVGTTGVGIKIYQNGVEIGDVPGAYDFTDTTTPLMIGNESEPSQIENFKGNITNFRWVVGLAVYTTTFSPPTIPLANIPGTQLLLAVSSELGVVRDSSSANRTPSNTGVIYSPELPIMPFVSAPSAPTIISIIPGNAFLDYYFYPPVSNGGSAITDYEYTTDGTTYRILSDDDNRITLLSNGSGPLVNGTSYPIQIRAVNSVGVGQSSNIVSATPGTVPDAPTSLVATPGNATVSIAFTPGFDGGSALTNYQYSTDGTNFAAFSPADTTSPVVISTVSSVGRTPLINGTTYSITLKAENEFGTSDASSAVSATPNLPVPDAPVITSGAPGDRTAIISFTQSAVGTPITNYEYSTNNGTTFRAFDPADTVSPVTISTLSSDGTTPLTNETLYNIQLKAVNATSTSDASNTIQVTPTPVITVIILGNSSVATVSPAIQSAKTALGYSVPLSITTQQLNGYTGTTLSSYQVVILYTDGGLSLNATLGANLNTFVSNGGHLIMASFCWGNVSAISSFNYNSYSTFQFKGTYSGVNSSTAVYTVVHPITTGIATSTGIGFPNIPNPILLTTTPGSQVIATFADGANTSFISVGQNGSARLVGINAYIVGTYAGNFQNTLKYVCNSIYWCKGLI